MRIEAAGYQTRLINLQNKMRQQGGMPRCLRESPWCCQAANGCVAGLPLFPEHRYTLPQIQYHYNHSLTTLRAWYEADA